MRHTGEPERPDFQGIMNPSRLFSLVSVLLVIVCLALVAVKMLLPALFILGTIVVAGIAFTAANWPR